MPETTPTLEEFRALYATDDNEWWRLSSGDHQNLFDEACAELDRATTTTSWWLSRESARRTRGSASRCWGASSDSLVLHALDPLFALYPPSDPSDLLACARTVALAPEHLRPALRAIVDTWTKDVLKKYSDTADAVRSALGVIYTYTEDPNE
jgi:hypothetical protein